LLAIGSVYLAVMAIRYAIRMSLYPRERWSGGSIPIFFRSKPEHRRADRDGDGHRRGEAGRASQSASAVAPCVASRCALALMCGKGVRPLLA
jgi:hypothetical protein